MPPRKAPVMEKILQIGRSVKVKRAGAKKTWSAMNFIIRQPSERERTQYRER